MAAPLFAIDDVLYLRESAAIGILEAVKISAVVTLTGDTWVYATSTGEKQPTPPPFGDRIQYFPRNPPYYNESELMLACDAYELVQATLQQRLSAIDSLRTSQC